MNPRSQRQVLVVMPEPYAASCVWGEQGALDEDGLRELGVSARLIERLHAWNAAGDALGSASNARESQVGGPLGVRLARQLQAELPTYEILLSDGTDERPPDAWNS